MQRVAAPELDALVKKEHGGAFPKNQKAKTELARVNLELERLKAQIGALEERKATLIIA